MTDNRNHLSRPSSIQTQEGRAADDEWHTVSATDKKRVMRKKATRQRRKNGSAVAHPTAELVDAVEEISRLDMIVEKCRAALRETKMYQLILRATLQSPTHEHQEGFTPHSILCYGLGNFSKTHEKHFSASMWQLACLLQLRHDFISSVKRKNTKNRTGNKSSDKNDDGDNSLVDVYFYDPVSTAVEVEFLTRHHNVSVLEHDEEGQRKVDAGTFVFLPHCPAILYENLLHANDTFPKSCMLMGNSIRNFCDALTPPTVEIDTLRARVDSLDETQLSIDDGQLGDFDKAFNDTYIIREKQQSPNE